VFVKGVVFKTEGNTCNKSTSNKTGPVYFFQGSNFCKLWHILQHKRFHDTPVPAVFTCKESTALVWTRAERSGSLILKMLERVTEYFTSCSGKIQ